MSGGSYYNYFRSYDPSIGRYTQSDPIGLGGGLNTYGYVLQNPTRFTDPYGLNAVWAGRGGYAAGEACLASGLCSAAVVGGGGLALTCLLQPEYCEFAYDNFCDNLGDAVDDVLGPMFDETADSERAKSRGQGIPDSQIGPSGKPKGHGADHKSKKGAREAAQADGKGPPMHHPSPARGQPHYHPTDASGKKVKPNVHHNY